MRLETALLCLALSVLGGVSAAQAPQASGWAGLRPPAGLRATADAPSRVTLSWTDRSEHEVAFRVERRGPAQGAFETLGETPANATAFIDETVRGQSLYLYRVRAVGAFGPSIPSAWTRVTTPVDRPPVVSTTLADGRVLFAEEAPLRIAAPPGRSGGATPPAPGSPAP